MPYDNWVYIMVNALFLFVLTSPLAIWFSGSSQFLTKRAAIVVNLSMCALGAMLVALIGAR